MPIADFVAFESSLRSLNPALFEMLKTLHDPKLFRAVVRTFAGPVIKLYTLLHVNYEFIANYRILVGSQFSDLESDNSVFHCILRFTFVCIPCFVILFKYDEELVTSQIVLCLYR
jgi:hypothetical protein